MSMSMTLSVPLRSVHAISIFFQSMSMTLDKMAIATKAKTFLASAIVQSVVTDIYNGRIIVSIAGNRSMVPDNYKQRAIMVYNPRTAPMLDHYRSIKHSYFSRRAHTLSD